MCGIYREKNKWEKKKEVCNGHVTVARGMGVANVHMTGGGGGALWARRARHSRPVGPRFSGKSFFICLSSVYLVLALSNHEHPTSVVTLIVEFSEHQWRIVNM